MSIRTDYIFWKFGSTKPKSSKMELLEFNHCGYIRLFSICLCTGIKMASLNDSCKNILYPFAYSSRYQKSLVRSIQQAVSDLCKVPTMQPIYVLRLLINIRNYFKLRHWQLLQPLEVILLMHLFNWHQEQHLLYLEVYLALHANRVFLFYLESIEMFHVHPMYAFSFRSEQNLYPFYTLVNFL